MINNYGGIIKINRIQSELTIDYISMKTGISKSQLSRIERNKENISIQNVVKIFSVMNIDVSTKNIDLQFENDFQIFYYDVVYLKDFESSYKVLAGYNDVIKTSLSYIKYLLANMIYDIIRGSYKKAEDYLYLEKYFDYLEYYQIQLFYDYIGAIYYFKGLHHESCSYYRKALTYRGNDYSIAMVNYHISVPLTNIGQLHEAFQHAKIARKIFANTVNIKRLTLINFQIAWIYSMLGNFDQSEKLNLACIEAFGNLGMNQNVEDTYNNLIWNYVCSGEFDKIIALEDKALQIMHEKHCICFYLSYAYYMLGDKKKAQQYILKAKNNMVEPTKYMKMMINAFKIFLSDSSIERKEKNLLKVYNFTRKYYKIDLEIFTLELLRNFYKSINNTRDEYECMIKLLNYYKMKK